MKKFAALFVSFWLFILPATAFASTLSLSPSTGTFNQSCPFSLDVIVDTQGIQSDGTDAILMYDTSKLSARNILNGPIYPDFPGNNIDTASGKITLAGLASVTSAFTGKGTLATINFTVRDTAPVGATQITFDFDPNDKAKTTDSNVVERSTVVDTLNSVTNGSYVIGTGACGAGQKPAVGPGGGPATPSATPAFTPPPQTLDQYVDKTGKGPGTPEMTSVIVIAGGILTILGILGLAFL